MKGKIFRSEHPLKYKNGAYIHPTYLENGVLCIDAPGICIYLKKSSVRKLIKELQRIVDKEDFGDPKKF